MASAAVRAKIDLFRVQNVVIVGLLNSIVQPPCRGVHLGLPDAVSI
jgi:hypothetical protein